MNSNLLRDFCWRVLRAYRQHFSVQGGGAWIEDDTIIFSFNHPKCPLFLRLRLSNPDLGKRLTVNLCSTGNTLSVGVDSTGIKWNSPHPNFLTPEEIQSVETLASRFYLIALDSADELRLLTSTMD